LTQGIEEATPIVNQYYDQAKSYYQPYAAGGSADYTTLRGLMENGTFNTAVPGMYQSGEQQPGYAMPDFNFEQYPGYQFRLQEGTNAIQNTAASRGSLLSGATLKAIQRYASNLASQEYQQAFDRYNTNRTAGMNLYQTNLGQYNLNRGFGAGQQQQQYENQNQQAGQLYNRWNNLANTGYNASGTLANMAIGQGQTLAGLRMNQANITAGGKQARANTLANVFSQAGMAGNQSGAYNSLSNTGNYGNAQSNEQSYYGVDYNQQPQKDEYGNENAYA
jgi:hypothetical protein